MTNLQYTELIRVDPSQSPFIRKVQTAHICCIKKMSWLTSEENVDVGTSQV